MRAARALSRRLARTRTRPPRGPRPAAPHAAGPHAPSADEAASSSELSTATASYEEGGSSSAGEHSDADEGGDEGAASADPSLCAVCAAQPHKYCCPGCGRRTCSLACAKQHKADTGCSGQRDRLAYVPLQAFDDKQLLSGARTRVRSCMRARLQSPCAPAPHLATLARAPCPLLPSLPLSRVSCMMVFTCPSQ